METHGILKQYRRKLLCAPDGLKHAVAYRTADIEKIILHRDPFLLIDAVHGLDLEEETIAATRHISASDPVFRGHFPGWPLYPGTLLLEMMGQAGIVLLFFLERKDHRIGPDAKPIRALPAKVLGADFLEPVGPGADVTLLAKRILWDGMLSRFVAQAIVNGKVACVGVAEVFIVGDHATL